MKIVALSDTHGTEWSKNLVIPKGDVLVYAGDFHIMNFQDVWEVRDWFATLQFQYIIYVPGNHDCLLEGMCKEAIQASIGKQVIYLDQESVTIRGKKFWGAPYSPLFNDWAFMKPDNELQKIWNKIPTDIDVVITHCPPFGILDQVLPRENSVGSVTLRDTLKKIQPRVHIFGHIHEGFGQYTDYNTDYYNVCIVDETYKLANQPTTIII